MTNFMTTDLPAGRELDALVAREVFGYQVRRTPAEAGTPSSPVPTRVRVPEYSTTLDACRAVWQWLEDRSWTYRDGGEQLPPSPKGYPRALHLVLAEHPNGEKLEAWGSQEYHAACLLALNIARRPTAT